MNCDHISRELTLYYYGELDQEDEEKIEQHLASCKECGAELEHIRMMGRAFSLEEPPIPDGLLSECRAVLFRGVRSEQAVVPGRRSSIFSWFNDLMHSGVAFRIPAGALALIAVGFLGGKYLTNIAAAGAQKPGAQQAGLVSVRSVESDPEGKVRIWFDDVSRHQVSGSPDDPAVLDLLLTSSRDQSNNGLRVAAVASMKNFCANDAVRDALVDALEHDPAVGVRMASIDGLQACSANPKVRNALTQALLNDVNAGVRVKAINLLTSHKDDSLVAPLQAGMERENNPYVRQRIVDALQDMKASVGTF